LPLEGDETEEIIDIYNMSFHYVLYLKSGLVC